jgi:MoaA/NifB/PqqE/SkfB family radical SAM enzyme/SAM-dependent methyltransferase
MNELHNYPKYYDLCYNRPQKIDVECAFIKDILKDFGSKRVLDICCGPAYHAINISKNGCETWGLDINSRMIEYAKAKNKKIKFIKADMTNFTVPFKFDACINTFYSFGYLLTEKDALANLKSVRACLKDGGIYLIFLKHIKDYLKKPKTSSWKVEGHDVKITVKESEHRDPKNRLVRFDESYNIFENGHARKINNSDVKRAWTVEEIRKLAQMSGFKVVGEYGDFNKSVRLNDKRAKEMIILLSATNGTQRVSELFNSRNALGIWGPHTVEVEITNRCNMHCRMCNRWKWIKDNPKLAKEMNLAQLQKLFSELKKVGTKKILISGGEPLIREDFQEIIKSIKSNGMEITIVTNGTLMNNKIADVLEKASAETIFSLDGSKAEIHDLSRGVKGTWQRTIEGIKKVVATKKKVDGGKVGINCTIQSLNASDIYNIAEVADNLGVDFIRFGITHGQSRTSVSYRAVEELRKAVEKIRNKRFHMKVIASPYLIGLVNGTLNVKYFKRGLPAYELFKNDPVTCMLCYQCSLIDAAGDVYPCSYSYFDNQPFNKSYNTKRRQNRIGNVLKEPFGKIWTSSRYAKFRKDHNPVRIENSANCCGQCEHYLGFKTIKDRLEKEQSQDEMVQAIKYMRACTWLNEFETELTNSDFS